MKPKAILATLLLLCALVSACSVIRLGGPTRLPDPPAPTALPLEVPTPFDLGQGEVSVQAGFEVQIYADGLDGPRMMAIGPDGHLYVAERGRRRVIRLPDRDQDGLADGVEVAADELESPNSLAFYRDGSLYVGGTRQVVRLSDPDAQGRFQRTETIVGDLPGGGHSTRTVLFSPDWETLFVSVGSSCNICVEDDPRRAAIVRYDPAGGGETVYAAGLRNAVGLAYRPGTDELWATNNGRDWLGDDLPPETVYVVRELADYGWPRCHSGRIVDPEFGDAGSCEGVAAPEVEMQAHAAPLGLAFYSGAAFPEAYQGDLFIALHGSWNRREPTGYKVVRIPFDDQGPGPVEDFAVGWLEEGGSSWGRPVDLITGPDGSLLVSDDAGGRIYRIVYTQ
jgi:glucose/arabinose dehydrogenase